jgi:hypothetical protein
MPHRRILLGIGSAESFWLVRSILFIAVPSPFWIGGASHGMRYGPEELRILAGCANTWDGASVLQAERMECTFTATARGKEGSSVSELASSTLQMMMHNTSSCPFLLVRSCVKMSC